MCREIVNISKWKVIEMMYTIQELNYSYLLAYFLNIFKGEISLLFMLWRIRQLLSGDSVNNDNFWTTAQSTQFCGTEYARNSKITVGDWVFSVWSMPSYKQESWRRVRIPPP
jgi:hypothetical protein